MVPIIFILHNSKSNMNHIAGFYSHEWWKVKDPDDPHDCTAEQLEEAIQGYFTADALPLSLSNEPGLSGKVSNNQLESFVH